MPSTSSQRDNAFESQGPSQGQGSGYTYVIGNRGALQGDAEYAEVASEGPAQDSVQETSLMSAQQPPTDKEPAQQPSMESLMMSSEDHEYF